MKCDKCGKEPAMYCEFHLVMTTGNDSSDSDSTCLCDEHMKEHIKNDHDDLNGGWL